MHIGPAPVASGVVTMCMDGVAPGESVNPFQAHGRCFSVVLFHRA
jgi:hypothetical protein